MKPLAILAAAAVASAPAAAFSQGYMPSLVASGYCRARSNGFDMRTSLKLAMLDARTPFADYVMLEVDGKTHRSDFLQSVMLIKELCPQFFDDLRVR